MTLEFLSIKEVLLANHDMRILWISNIQFPATCDMLGIPHHVGGGWMYSLAMELLHSGEIDLAVSTVYAGSVLTKNEIGRIRYYLIPKRESPLIYDRKLESYWEQVIKDYDPDIIHIHGTEYAYGLACMNACPNRKYIISVQGLVSVYSEFYYAGIKCSDLLKTITINDIRRHDTVIQGKRKFERRGLLEHEYIKRTSQIIGRTFWDYTHTKAINPEVNYHKCNEVLRSGFYESANWDLSGKTDYSLFVSQAGYPIKGLHQVLKAVSLVRNFFPKTSLKVAGVNILSKNRKWDRWSLNGYGLLLKKMVAKYALNDCVTFLGPLNEQQMIEQYLKAHAFICPSSIENSPNSVGEAQILGTPCIASFVGGIPDMVIHEKTGLLYRFEDYKMLAYLIMKVFSEDDIARSLSAEGRNVAEQRHNRENIKKRMLEIYKGII